MAAELGLLSLTHLQKIAQSQQNHQHHHKSVNGSSWMWNPKQPQGDDDSWEVRAFAEDTGNIMGTTWPPRSYTCTFCRREFRSAQALGGHMNVHRRDRARLHHTQQGAMNPSSSLASSSAAAGAAAIAPSSALVIPAQEFARNGLCLLYPLHNPNGLFTTSTMHACAIETPSTLLSVSPYPPMGQPSVNFQAVPQGLNSACQGYSTKAEPSMSLDSGTNINNNCKDSAIEELDLELRLGHRPETSSS